MLTSPQFFFWATHPTRGENGPHFAEAETLHEMWATPGPHCLIAGDLHRIPFPRRVLESPQYQRTHTSCRVVLWMNTGDHRYRTVDAVDYVMNIALSDTSLVDRRLQDQASDAASSVLGTAGVPTDTRDVVDNSVEVLEHQVARGRPDIPDPVMVGADVFLYASPTANDWRPWHTRIELSTNWPPGRMHYRSMDESERMLRTGDSAYSRGYQATIFYATVFYDVVTPD